MGKKTKKELENHYYSIISQIIDNVFNEYSLSETSISGIKIIEAFQNFNEHGEYKVPEESQVARINRKRDVIQSTIDDYKKVNDKFKGFGLNSRDELNSMANEKYIINLDNLKYQKNDIEKNKPEKPKEYTVRDFDFKRPESPNFSFNFGTKYDRVREDVRYQFERYKTLESVVGIEKYQGSRKQYGDMLKMYTELKRVNKSRGILESFFNFKKHRKEKNLLEEIKNKLKEHPLHDPNVNLDDLNSLTQKTSEVSNAIFNEFDRNNIKKVLEYNNNELKKYNNELKNYNDNLKKVQETILDMGSNPDKYKNEIIEKYYDEVKDNLIKVDASCEKKINDLMGKDKRAFEKIANEVNNQMKQFENSLNIGQEEKTNLENKEKYEVGEDGLMIINEFDEESPIANNYENIKDDQIQNSDYKELGDQEEIDF